MISTSLQSIRARWEANIVILGGELWSRGSAWEKVNEADDGVLEGLKTTNIILG